ncbi:MAG TPA: exostosin family protein [Stellaceae bacterium]|nr:exostosin family protein [Stellaceae bacterium]
MEKRLTVHLTSLRGERSDTLSKAFRIIPSHCQTRYSFSRIPEEADIILYLESGYFGISDINLIRRLLKNHPRSTHFMFSESDWPFPIIPGCYCSLTRVYDWAHSWSYLLPETCTNLSDPCQARFLYSFLGRASTHPLRRQILQLSSPSTPCFDVDEAEARIPNFDRVKSYNRLLRESLFVLCPRGIGASSVRLFEAMRAGRVPVIISDPWVRPPYVPWEQCSVRVAEKDVKFIPDILSGVPNPEAMGACAQEHYLHYYSQENFLERLVDHLTENPQFVDAFKHLKRRIISTLSTREIRTLLSQLLRPHLRSAR